MKDYENLWNEIHCSSQEPVFRRVDDKHPLDFYLGKDMSGEKLLLLLTNTQPPGFAASQAIHITFARRQDNRWALVIKLVRPEFESLFLHLCMDLIESSRNCVSSEAGTSFVLNRFLRWQKLLEKGYSGLLDDTSLRGLIGELIFIEKVAIPNYGKKQVIRSWVGPMGVDQDFQFPDGWCEVKTVHLKSSVVTISSIEQLDLDEPKGELALVWVEKVASNQNYSFTPSSLVQRVKTILDDPYLCEEFENRLLGVGYIEREEYQNQYFVLKGISCYPVGGNFPRLRRQNIPVGIKNVRYDIEISALAHLERKILFGGD